MIRSAVIVEGYALDLLQDVATDFTYSIQDIREPDQRRTDFSKTIEIPGTPRNNALFAHLFDINIENDYNPALPNIGYNYNPNKAAKAVVLVDSVEVFRGIIRIQKITNDQGNITYETNVLGRLSDILLAIGDSTLSDLDFSDMDHALTMEHLINVWTNPNAYRYTYPLIDYGLTTDGVHYPIGGFAPAIYVKEYVDRMFAGAGFTYTSPFFNQPYFRSLIIPNTEKNEFTQDAVSARFLKCGSVAWETTNRRTGEWREVNNWWGNPEIDPYGFVNYTGNQGDSDHITFTRDIETSVQISFTYHSNKANSIINVRLNGEVIWNMRAGNYWSGAHTEVIEIPKRQFSAGDVLTLSIDLTPKGKVSYTTATTILMPSPIDTSAYPVDQGAAVVMADFVSKEVSQKDFFKSLIMMHNLFVFTDPDNEKNLYIIPQSWFYDNFAGNAVDWTYKVDHSKPVEIIPMGELGAREFLFTYKQDDDYYNADRYFKKYGEVYGQKRYTTDNEFEKDTQKVELIFSPTPGVQSTTNQRVIPHIYKVSADGIKERDTFNIRILQYGGFLPSFEIGNENAGYAQWHVVDSSNVVLGSFIHYPYAGMTDAPPPFHVSRDLCFGPPQELFFSWAGGFPDIGLYRYYWEGFISEITNKDSKLWRGYVLLTPNDIANLDFKKLVKIDNTYFKLNKVESYKPLTDDVTRVELFKTAVQVEIVRPGFLKWSDEGYLLHSDESPARIPYA